MPPGKAEFPPKVAKLLDLEFISYDDQEQIMHIRMPIKPEFDNPFNVTFGGTFGMYFDMCFGPFSGLITRAAATSLDLNVTYIKPIMVSDQYIHVKGYVNSQSRQFLNLRGEAFKEDGTLVATATSRMMIFDPSRIKR